MAIQTDLINPTIIEAFDLQHDQPMRIIHKSAMPPKLTELEADEYQRHGQELYRQGKYQAALQRFNAVMPLPLTRLVLIIAEPYTVGPTRPQNSIENAR